MMLSLASESGFQEERKLLQDVFEVEERPDGSYFVYNYDQRYYKVLSACAKLRLKTRNLPEGNPSYIEVSAADWDTVFTGFTGGPIVRPGPKPENSDQQKTIFSPVSPVSPVATEAFLEEDETTDFNIEEAVEELAQASRTATFSTESSFNPVHFGSAPLSAAPSFNIDSEPRKTVTMEAIDLEQRQKETYRARTEALQSREEAISSREDAVRSREDAAKNRESSIGALEREIAASEAIFIEKEKDIEARYEKLERQRVELEDQAALLHKQKQQLSDLAAHVRRVADAL
jgi:hypothetical protein